MAQVILKAGRVQPVWAGHPWIFPQGIEKVRGRAEHGSEVQVLDARGNVLGRGLYATNSPIAVRMFTSEPERSLDRSLIEEKLRGARALRAAVGLPEGTMTQAYRLFHGEGDGLPGLIVDKFDDVLVIQLGTAGMAKRREAILDALEAVFAPRAILERTSDKIAQAEGFEAKHGLLRGEAITELVALERGLRFAVPLELTQKTGFYFDQRPLRALIEKLSHGRSVLDTYCYVGAIGLSAARGGATSVSCVDSSAPALELGRQFAQENGLSVDFVRAKALDFFAAAERKWDLVVADPPKLAQSRAGLDKAMRAFRHICEAAVKVTAPAGIVVVSSCSAALGIEQVERCLALGARDAGRRAIVFERVFQGADHPVHPAFGEGRYLSTAVAWVE